MNDKVSIAWCVQSQDGWCACQTDKEPEDGLNNVPTVCGYFVVLPWGFDKRIPTCPECLAKMEA